jgi:BirA family biotin operon repressor/biotin-[acetyl-CoA-carboxylase] ligase
MNEPYKKIIILSEVGSTNNYANRLIMSKAAEEGTVVMTHFQGNGRGQASNRWESEKGKNLLMSIILFPGFLPAANQFLLSKVAGLSILEFLQREVKDVTIKWPNDIYVGNKKIAGILIENSIKGNFLSSSVIGIGLNLNQGEFLSDAPNPVSLKQLSGKEYQVEDVMHEILKLFFIWYKRLQQGNMEKIDLTYFSQLYRKEEWEIYSREGYQFEAKIVGIGEFGQLILQKRDETTRAYMFKEIEFVL